MFDVKSVSLDWAGRKLTLETGKIARQAGDLSQSTVIEVGPGPGGLTRALLMHGARRVVAVERDERGRPHWVEGDDEEILHAGGRWDRLHRRLDGPAAPARWHPSRAGRAAAQAGVPAALSATRGGSIATFRARDGRARRSRI